MAFASRNITIDRDAMADALESLRAAKDTGAAIAGEMAETRKTLDIDRPDFARVAGISPHRYTNLEKGVSQASLDETIRIVEAWVRVADGDLTPAEPLEDTDGD